MCCYLLSLIEYRDYWFTTLFFVIVIYFCNNNSSNNKLIAVVVVALVEWTNSAARSVVITFVDADGDTLCFVFACSTLHDSICVQLSFFENK